MNAKNIVATATVAIVFALAGATGDSTKKAGTSAGPVVLTGLSEGDNYLKVTVVEGTVTAVTPVPTFAVGPAPPSPTPNPTPIPTPTPTAFEAEVERQAKMAIAAGGSLTTGAAFSEVYFLASAGVTDGSLDPAQSLAAANAGAKYILNNSTDAAKWMPFEQSVRNSLQVLDSQGSFNTKADYAAALKAVANGLNLATGHKNLGTAFLGSNRAKAEKLLSDPAGIILLRKEFGILDGIDLVKLMEFIKFIIELFKLFAPK